MLYSRRSFFRQCTSTFAGLLAMPAVLLVAMPAVAGGIPRGPMLEERLRMGLRVKTASDRAFISRVVELVQSGDLPVKLVDSSYFYAREKAKDRGRQSNNAIIYFRPALIARAKAIGVGI